MRFPSNRILEELAKLQNIPSAADKKPELRFERNCNFNKAYPRKKGYCRRCKKKVPEGRTYWCSDVCNIDCKIRCNPGYADRYLRIRDKGICSLCQVNTKKTPKEPGLRRMWHVDHIVPVVEGGGHCGLDNLQTLCIPCHKGETKKLRARMKKSK